MDCCACRKWQTNCFSVNSLDQARTRHAPHKSRKSIMPKGPYIMITDMQSAVLRNASWIESWNSRGTKFKDAQTYTHRQGLPSLLNFWLAGLYLTSLSATPFAFFRMSSSCVLVFFWKSRAMFISVPENGMVHDNLREEIGQKHPLVWSVKPNGMFFISFFGSPSEAWMFDQLAQLKGRDDSAQISFPWCVRAESRGQRERKRDKLQHQQNEHSPNKIVKCSRTVVPLCQSNRCQLIVRNPCKTNQQQKGKWSAIQQQWKTAKKTCSEAKARHPCLLWTRLSATMPQQSTEQNLQDTPLDTILYSMSQARIV